MFNIGGPEVLVIALIALVVVGPDQLPSIMRQVGKYASQLRSMSTGLRQEFMAGVDEIDPTKWDGQRGTGEPGKPIVPKGYAERVAAGEDGNPFKTKPVSQEMADATPEEAAAEAEASAKQAEAEARRAMEKARKLRQEAKAKSNELADSAPGSDTSGNVASDNGASSASAEAGEPAE